MNQSTWLGYIYLINSMFKGLIDGMCVFIYFHHDFFFSGFYAKSVCTKNCLPFSYELLRAIFLTLYILKYAPTQLCIWLYVVLKPQKSQLLDQDLDLNGQPCSRWCETRLVSEPYHVHPKNPSHIYVQSLDYWFTFIGRQTRGFS